MTKLTRERLEKILSETQAVIMEHNSRCVRGSVEVDARLFESMLIELQLHRYRRTIPLPLPACTYADHSYPAYSKAQVVALLEQAGIKWEAE